MRSVYIIENPLMDYIAHVDQEFPERVGAFRGGMKAVEAGEFRRILESIVSRDFQPGGSGANTARAVSLLLGEESAQFGRVAYTGAVGDDEPGRRFDALLECLNIETALAKKGSPTGVSAVLLTPDHERSMLTQLGASLELSPDDIRSDILIDSRILYTTAYLWGGRSQLATLSRGGNLALEAKVPLCFDLADPEIVRGSREALGAWIERHVSYLLGNREELCALTACEGTDAEIIRAAGLLAPTIVMKVGRGGCVIFGEGRLLHVPGEQVVARDTTGAGDSFAAGFLYGLIRGKDLATCGRLANRIASRTITIDGCDFDLLDRTELLAVLGTEEPRA